MLHQVGDLAVGAHLDRHLLGDRQRPERLAGPGPGADRLRDQGLVVAEDAGDPVAERRHAGAGQGGDVDDQVGLRLGGERQRVGEHQPALGVGVEHLDGRAAVHREHVAGTGRVAGEHVLGHRHEGR